MSSRADNSPVHNLCTAYITLPGGGHRICTWYNLLYHVSCVGSSVLHRSYTDPAQSHPQYGLHFSDQSVSDRSDRLSSSCEELPISLTILRAQFGLGLGHRRLLGFTRTNAFEGMFRSGEILIELLMLDQTFLRISCTPTPWDGSTLLIAYHSIA